MNWGTEHYNMQNMMGMGGMMQNMMPGMPPMPYPMMGDMNQMGQMPPPMNQLCPPMNQIGPGMNPLPPPMNMGALASNPQIADPAPPSNQPNDARALVAMNTSNDTQGDMQTEATEDKTSQGNKDRSDKRDKERERERSRRRSRSRNRDRDNKDRSSRNDRGERNRDRQSKWDNNVKPTAQIHPSNENMLSQNQAQMQYGNMMSSMMPVPGMLMPNMMMMNPRMPMANEVPTYFSAGVILPPLPGSAVQHRSEAPPGCRTIFVAGLPQTFSQEVIHEIFSRFGEITELKLNRGICHLRFLKPESVDLAFNISGYRIKSHDQNESEATTIYMDYSLNQEDQSEFANIKRKHEPAPNPRLEYCTPHTFATVSEKIKSDSEFSEGAPILATWLERGECNKKNANNFYSLIQASNNQLRRLFNEKMQLDDEFQVLKNTMKDKFARILIQFEQVAKILTAAKHQRVSDHFSKQQRKNIEMWLKMTEELDNMKEEFNATFDEDDVDKVRNKKDYVSVEKYEQLQVEKMQLTYELEGYKNEAHLAKEEAERKFEKFKAHFIAQQALQNPNKQIYPPLPSPPMPKILDLKPETKKPDVKVTPTSTGPVPASDAKLISVLSAFLMVHPRGASLDYLVSYVRSMAPEVSQTQVHDILLKYNEVFRQTTTGVGACIENKWRFASFDSV